jgi:type 1 glutamine amidotransferase
LLIFSRTVEYRHDSIPKGVTALTELGEERGWQVAATEDPAEFTDESLAEYDAIVFLSTTGDVLDSDQQAAFERFIRSGKGYVGIHSASDTEYDWPWYGELVGAYFREHPSIQQADLVVEDTTHAATLGLPSPWTRRDEWYAFSTNPRAAVDVLLALDEASYDPGTSHMDGDHPIAWCREFDGGRSFYTALGHTNESYSEANFLAHVAGGIEWAVAP